MKKIALAIVIVAAANLSAQKAQWKAQRTVDGQPDLQGTWANNNATPLERPAEFAGRARLSDAEVATLKARSARLFDGGGDAAFGDNLFSALLANPDTFVSVDGATISIQDGSPPKHLHPNANEIQYILEGKGTIWLGDKEVAVKQGDLVIIPKGTPHGGTKPDGRTIKAIAIKTPPQAPDDTKLLN